MAIMLQSFFLSGALPAAASTGTYKVPLVFLSIAIITSLILAIALAVGFSKRTQAEARLRTSENRLHAMIDNAFDAVVSMDQDGRISEWNRQAELIFGWTAAEAIGMDVSQLIIPEDLRTAHGNGVARFLELGRGAMLNRRTELSAVNRAGERFPIEMTVSAQKRPDDHQFIAFFRDITERKRTEQALSESEKKLYQAQKMEAIGNLTGGMAHDFNNLLGIMIGNLDLLLTQLEGAGETEHLAQAALDAALRGADLTRRLLAFARRQPLQPESIDVNKLVEGITRLLSRILGEDIEISLDLDPQVWQVAADPAQLEATLTNLATNARDAMANGGQLFISTCNRSLDAAFAGQTPEVAPGDYVMIVVRDTGVGMNPDIMSRIFEPFFTTKERGKGTGLGLSMVFGFLKQSGGHINVASEPDRGTTFRLYLPRATKPMAAPAMAPATPVPAPPNATVLVVEDNDAMRRIVTRHVADLGYHVLEAENAAVALELLTAYPQVDLMFTDIVMPGKLNGLELARIALERWPALKVVLTSGFPGGKLEGQREPPTGIRLLSKPYRKEELAQVLYEVLSSPASAA